MGEKSVILISTEGEEKPFTFPHAENILLNKSNKSWRLTPDSRYAIINGKLDEKESVKKQKEQATQNEPKADAPNPRPDKRPRRGKAAQEAD